jgi:flagellum-specific ATP synthase
VPTTLLDRLPTVPSASQWNQTLQRCLAVGIHGRVLAIRGNSIVASGFPAPVSSLCKIQRRTDQPLICEVIGFDGGATLLAPLAVIEGVNQGDPVELARTFRSVSVSDDLIGRVLDALGEPIDDFGRVAPGARAPIESPAVPALDRPPIQDVLPTGVRAIDAFLTLGQGQRVGIFAASGVGKSTLLGMMARGTQADVVVVALIGERGREVRDFLERDLGDEGRKRCVTVVATSDQPASLRITAAKSATAIAEAYRDAGKNVLLLMDSVTRFAMAQREVGLAAGEVPTTRGYPPSVFATLPRLVERAGRNKRGSITGVYTVLVEGDDPNEPISDTLRGLLDGHIHLSQAIATRGRYPAIDVLPSLSRLQTNLVPEEHRQSAITIRSTMATYRENEDLISIGAYQKGSNAAIDHAITMRPEIERFLAQPQGEIVDWQTSCHELSQLASRCCLP